MLRCSLITITTLFISIAHASLPINIKQNMSYDTAREILIKDGWQTVRAKATPNGTPLCYNNDYSDEPCEYYEITACSGTGMGFCRMYFYDGDDTYLDIITEGGPPPDAVIRSWNKTDEFMTEVIEN